MPKKFVTRRKIYPNLGIKPFLYGMKVSALWSRRTCELKTLIDSSGTLRA
jgi:hypothetical protein